MSALFTLALFFSLDTTPPFDPVREASFIPDFSLGMVTFKRLEQGH
jgi:hypothetical protein